MRQRHPSSSEPDQQPGEGLRRAGRVRKRNQVRTEGLLENFRIADDMLAGREYFFDHFTAPDAHFFWCTRRATQLGVDLSGFPNVTAHFNRMQERPSVKKLYALEKEVQEGFAKTAYATLDGEHRSNRTIEFQPNHSANTRYKT